VTISDATPAQALASRVAKVSWYHSLQLPDGIVTPGAFDTLGELSRLPFPTSLEGRRCLDVATADGFWAFEMERRGAAEVLAIDLPAERMDWPGNAPTGPPATNVGKSNELRSFDIAHEALGSSVQSQELSVYDLAPGDIGEFDFVFVGSLLGHLRDPVGALAAIASVLRGELLSADFISPPLTLLHPGQPIARFEAPGWPLWWVPNLQAYRRLFDAAGLNVIATGQPFFIKRGPAYNSTFGGEGLDGHHGFHQRLKRAAGARLGNLHAWVRATAG
jgi:tRNA (mo5U34)-methyltransferase